MIRLIDLGRTIELMPPLAQDMNSRFNPSIVYNKDTGEFTISVRESSYCLFEKERQGFMHSHSRQDKRIFNNVYLGTAKDPFKEIQWEKVETVRRRTNVRFQDIEDVRLVQWNGRLCYSGTRRDWEGLPEENKIEEGTIIDNKMVESKRLQSKNKIEKNYVPVEDQPNTYVHTFYPMTVLKENEFSTIDTNNMVLVKHRGSSQMIAYEDGYLAITHTKTSSSVYSHYFAKFDKEFNLTALSEPFTFDRNSIEFTCGICSVEDKLYISYAMMDRRAFLFEMEKSQLDKLNFVEYGKPIVQETSQEHLESSGEHLVLVQYKYNADSKEIISAVDSFKRHAKFDYSIFLIGDSCPWLPEIPVVCGDHSDLNNPPCRHQHIHVARDLKQALTLFKGKYDEFCLMSDDFFCLNDFTWEDLKRPKYNSKGRTWVSSQPRAWQFAKMKTMRFLAANRMSSVDYTTHCFAVYNIENMLSLIDKYDLTNPPNDYTIEDLYGNTYWTDPEHIDNTRVRFNYRHHYTVKDVADARRAGKLFLNFEEGVSMRLLLAVDDETLG